MDHKLGGNPYILSDGSASAGFTNFIGGNDSRENQRQMCGALPPQLRRHAPLCTGGKR